MVVQLAVTAFGLTGLLTALGEWFELNPIGRRNVPGRGVVVDTWRATA